MMTSSLGHTSPGEVLPPHLASEDMQSDLPQEMVFSGSCIRERTGYGVIFPALRLQECGKDAQLRSVSDAMSTLAGSDSAAYGGWVKMQEGNKWYLYWQRCKGG